MEPQQRISLMNSERLRYSRVAAEGAERVGDQPLRDGLEQIVISSVHSDGEGRCAVDPLCKRPRRTNEKEAWPAC